MVAVSSWGRLTRAEHTLYPITDRRHIAPILASTQPGIAYGMGRSYGDVCLNPQGTLWHTTGLDRFIDFDDKTGRLICEAGVLLRDIQQLCIPRGWMLPVTPGTQWVTVGGAIANDVHGKNHHVCGSFGNHVQALTLVRTDGEIIRCGPHLQPEWFAATVGGLGLTGFISTVEIQLRRVAGPWLHTETIPYADLDTFFQLADASEAGWEHTVSWIDCVAGKTGRGIFMRANPIEVWAKKVPAARTRRMPCVPPFSLVNRFTLPPFNHLYFHAQKWLAGPSLAHYTQFFYPLDNLLEWNRLYGPAGFYQYQSLVPRAGGKEAVQAMLDVIAASGEGSFLAVLKTFGDRPSLGLLSFPQPGVTLALDFPNRGAQTATLFARLDAIVRAAGGRIYPAKDARMPRDFFEESYPQFSTFLPFRDPGISSALSRRLMGS